MSGIRLSSLFEGSIAGDWHRIWWIIHVTAFVAFLVILPITKLRHMLTSPVNMFLSARERPKGAMRAVPNLMEADDIETIGASLVTDLTWKQIFDTDSCTVCGRCTSVCPANITGKPLDPREMILKTGEAASAMAGVSPHSGIGRQSLRGPASCSIGSSRKRHSHARPVEPATRSARWISRSSIVSSTCADT